MSDDIDLFEYRYNAMDIPKTVSKYKAAYLLNLSKTSLENWIRGSQLTEVGIKMDEVFRREILIDDKFLLAQKLRQNKDNRDIRDRKHVEMILNRIGQSLSLKASNDDFDKLIEHGEILEEIGRDLNPTNLKWLKETLEALSSETFNSSQEFVISVLVVEKNTRFPSANFWHFVKYDLAAFEDHRETKEAFMKRQLIKIANFHHS